ncbi:hypothetical protein [Micromonospora maris]|nr:hypothetical protein [Micromonospora maris]AEB47401.1 hypothetical protein VAB18032_01585 [Micromonospora maris AB-18-032]
MEEDLQHLIAQARKSALVDDSDVDQVLARYQKEELTEREAARLLKGLYQGVPLKLAELPGRQVGTEWISLLAGMQEESTQWQNIARSQYRQGFFLLPASVVAVLAATFAGHYWLKFPEKELTALAAAALAALATHSFFVFRVHQQARIAAERLSEKRAAILFVQAALARATPDQAPNILAAAGAMFLGHHAPETIPLQSTDRGAA